MKGLIERFVGFALVLLMVGFIVPGFTVAGFTGVLIVAMVIVVFGYGIEKKFGNESSQIRPGLMPREKEIKQPKCIPTQDLASTLNEFTSQIGLRF